MFCCNRDSEQTQHPFWIKHEVDKRLLRRPFVFKMYYVSIFYLVLIQSHNLAENSCSLNNTDDMKWEQGTDSEVNETLYCHYRHLQWLSFQQIKCLKVSEGSCMLNLSVSVAQAPCNHGDQNRKQRFAGWRHWREVISSLLLIWEMLRRCSAPCTLFNRRRLFTINSIKSWVRLKSTWLFMRQVSVNEQASLNALTSFLIPKNRQNDQAVTVLLITNGFSILCSPKHRTLFT